MTRYTAIKRPTNTGLRETTSTLVWSLFLACMALHARIPAQAAPATISIPGAVTVTIQPPEAVADGARWSVDGGALQVSGTSLTNLAAGTHAVQFANLAAWQEPDTTEVLVIGGKQATVTATYRPLPRFYFRDVPEQRARVGKALEFLVRSDDPGDPQSPAPGVPLQMTATPPPAGALAFDAATGRLTYSPSVSDRLPFIVRLATSQGLAGTFEMTPLNALALEDSVIEYDRALPDAESRDYMNITEISNGSEVFNDANADTFTASVSGQTLVFAANHPAHLHLQFSERRNQIGRAHV